MSKDKYPRSYYLNGFLLDLSGALIAYQKSKDLYAFAESFTAARWNYLCGDDDCATQNKSKHDSKVEMLLESTYALYSQLSMLDCCPAHDKCYEDETRHEVAQYIPSVIDYVDSCKITSRFADLTPDFQEDYAVTYQRLIHNEIDLAQAKKSILYWQGAIADDVLEEVVMLMRYSYLEHLAD
jgi:hypothetical protein